MGFVKAAELEATVAGSTGNAKDMQLADNLLWLDWSGFRVAVVPALMHSLGIIEVDARTEKAFSSVLREHQLCRAQIYRLRVPAK